MYFLVSMTYFIKYNSEQPVFVVDKNEFFFKKIVMEKRFTCLTRWPTSSAIPFDRWTKCFINHFPPEINRVRALFLLTTYNRN